jgi:hypothetical protein
MQINASGLCWGHTQCSQKIADGPSNMALLYKRKVVSALMMSQHNLMSSFDIFFCPRTGFNTQVLAHRIMLIQLWVPIADNTKTAKDIFLDFCYFAIFVQCAIRTYC